MMDFLCVRHRRGHGIAVYPDHGLLCMLGLYTLCAGRYVNPSSGWVKHAPNLLVFNCASISCVRAYYIPLIVFLQSPQGQPSAPSSSLKRQRSTYDKPQATSHKPQAAGGFRGLCKCPTASPTRTYSSSKEKPYLRHRHATSAPSSSCELPLRRESCPERPRESPACSAPSPRAHLIIYCYDGLS
jgi:hypothetical protein